ncbi:MAG: beta-N-acetylhexosaminidase [Prevotella sp.]
MKKNFLMLLLGCTLPVASMAVEADYNIVPLPQQVELLAKEQPFVLSAATTVVVSEDMPELQRDAQFLIDYVAEATGIRLTIAEKAKTNYIRLAIDRKMAAEEGYAMTVDKKGITVSGRTPQGVFYGVQTLRKSLPTGQSESISMPAVSIKDQPRFGYRGLMLDCARHFFPLDFVKRYIDLIAMHNMNTFHWHLSDDQGWRIEIRKYPLLTQIGSVRECTVIGNNSELYDNVPYGGFYTQEDAREIVRYAAERYITVVPEIDMPGHMLGALAAYPDLGCTGGPYKVSPLWGVFPDVLCLGNEKVYQFCEDVLKEIIDIFPSQYIHIGGDEAPRDRWAVCPKCQALAKQQGLETNTIQSYFTNRIEKFINAQGRRIIGWDEILEGPINQSATIMSWRGIEPGVSAANKGHDVIMSPCSHAYLDYYQTDGRGNGPILIGGNLPLEKVYSLDPVPENIDENLRKHIIGVQGNLWTEYIAYPSVVEYQVLPRMAALADIQWSDKPKNFEAFKRRLEKQKRLYDVYGLKYAK